MRAICERERERARIGRLRGGGKKETNKHTYPALLRHLAPTVLGQHSPLVSTVPAGHELTQKPWSQMAVVHWPEEVHTLPAVADGVMQRPEPSGLCPLGHAAAQAPLTQMPEAHVVPTLHGCPLLSLHTDPTSVVRAGQVGATHCDDVDDPAGEVVPVAHGSSSSPVPPIGPPGQYDPAAQTATVAPSHTLPAGTRQSVIAEEPVEAVVAPVGHAVTVWPAPLTGPPGQ